MSADGALRCAHPPVNSRNRSCKPSRMSASDRARTRAAANSIASGIPSRRRQISTTAAALSSVTLKPGLAKRARSVNNSIAASATKSEGTRHVASPVTPIGSRLVASNVNLGAPPNSATISSAQASSRCSQLSSTTSI